MQLLTSSLYAVPVSVIDHQPIGMVCTPVPPVYPVGIHIQVLMYCTGFMSIFCRSWEMFASVMFIHVGAEYSLFISSAIVEALSA